MQANNILHESQKQFFFACTTIVSVSQHQRSTIYIVGMLLGWYAYMPKFYFIFRFSGDVSEGVRTIIMCSHPKDEDMVIQAMISSGRRDSKLTKPDFFCVGPVLHGRT